LGLAFGLLVAVAAAQEDAVKKELEKLQGTWTYLALEQDGKPMPPEELKNMTVTFTGDKFVLKQGSELIRAGTQKIDPTKKPKTIDATYTEGETKGMTRLGIYELTDDTARVCFSTTGKDRPTEFKTAAGSNRYMITIRREKK
jgi:uncharacterized protein (TIGR03067 family)